MNYIKNIETPLGMMLGVSDGETLCGLYFNGAKNFPIINENYIEGKNIAVLEDTAYFLERYFKGECPEPNIPISLKGSDFQMLVWRLLNDIPYGKTVSYSFLAKKAAAGRRTMSARAIGAAVGRNPISILLPCHRVIGSDGALVGYAGGLDKNAYLLDLEISAANLTR